MWRDRRRDSDGQLREERMNLLDREEVGHQVVQVRGHCREAMDSVVQRERIPILPQSNSSVNAKVENVAW
jgi:hypothetical protein